MRIKKYFVVVILFCIIFFLFILCSNNFEGIRYIPIFGQAADMDISCYEDSSTLSSFPNFDNFEGRRKSSGMGNIFFHETSCFGKNGLVELNYRQACAIESAARMNPGMEVKLLFLSPASPSNQTNWLITQLHTYGNVKVSRLQMINYFKDTPIETWYKSHFLESSQWPRSHMSDILRYLTLWKFGGIYLDLDVIITRSLEDLVNFAGAEDLFEVAAGVIGLNSTGLGHQIAHDCLRDLMKNFRGDVWGNNGPGVITRTLQKLCAVKYAKDMTLKRCSGFKVFSPAAFYPIFYKDWKRYFSANDINETMKLIKEARAIHVWNQLSSSEVVHVGSRIPYTLVAQEYCPRIYASCSSIF